MDSLDVIIDLIVVGILIYLVYAIYQAVLDYMKHSSNCDKDN